MSARENTRTTEDYERVLALFLSETDRTEPRTARFTFRLRPEEMRELRSVARTFGMEPSRFVRRLVLVGLRFAKQGANGNHTNHI